MTINTFANLKQAIERWSHRTDLSDIIDNLVELAENDIDKQLKLRNNELRATATASTSSRFLALPDGFLKMRRMSLINGSLNYEVTYRSPESMTIQNAAGKPRYFTVTSQLEFDRVPDSAYTVEMSYFRRITPLTTSNTTNDVLTDYPDLYLWGSLKHLASWAQDVEQFQMYKMKFDEAMILANKQERNGRYGVAPQIRVEGSTP